MILIKNLLKIDNMKFSFSLIFLSTGKYFYKIHKTKSIKINISKILCLLPSISLGKFFDTIHIYKYNDKNSHFKKFWFKFDLLQLGSFFIKSSFEIIRAKKSVKTDISQTLV